MRGNEQCSKQTDIPVLQLFIFWFYAAFWKCSAKHFCDDAKKCENFDKNRGKLLKKANMRLINGNDGLSQQDLPEWGNRVCHRHGSDGQGGRVY